MQTFNITIDDEKQAARPETLFKIYGAIETQARNAAPAAIKSELRISQDARIKTRFYVAVSERMAPHLLTAVQKQVDGDASGLRAYFYKLQEQLMGQMFAGAKDINISLR